MIYRFGAGLYYANATRFTAEILELVDNADPPLKWLCLAASAMGDVDYSGADAIRAVAEELKSKGVTLVVSEVDPVVDAPARRVRADRQDRSSQTSSRRPSTRSRAYQRATAATP